MVRVVISGATGYVGSTIAAACVDAGHDVVGLSRRPHQEGQSQSRINHVIGDASDPSVVLELMEEADVYVETAGTDVPTTGVRLFRNLLDGLAGRGKTLIQTSGTGVLSRPTPLGTWCEDSLDEDDTNLQPPPPLRERVRVEQLMRSAAGGVRSIIIRPPQVWGRGGSKQIPALFESAKLRGAVCYVGAGQHCYSNVHVDDLARLYVAAIERGVAGTTYHAVAGEENWRAVALAVGDVMDCSAMSITLEDACTIWGERNARLFFGASSRSRSRKTKQALGWEPEHLDLLDDIRNGSYRARFADSGRLSTESREQS